MRIIALLNGFPIKSETFLFHRLTGLMGDDLLLLAKGTGDPLAFERFDKLGSLLTKTRFRSHWIRYIEWSGLRLISPKHFKLLTQWSLQFKDPSFIFDYAVTRNQKTFDIAYGCFGVNASRAALLKELGATKKAVASFHGFDLWRPLVKNPKYYHWIFDRLDLAFVNCQNHKDRLCALGLSEDKIKIHHSAVDVDFFSQFQNRQSWDSKPLKLLSAGRLVPKKGFEYSIACIDRLRSRGIIAHLTLLGSGKEKVNYERDDSGS